MLPCPNMMRWWLLGERAHNIAERAREGATDARLKRKGKFSGLRVYVFAMEKIPKLGLGERERERERECPDLSCAHWCRGGSPTIMERTVLLRDILERGPPPQRKRIHSFRFACAREDNARGRLMPRSRGGWGRGWPFLCSFGVWGDSYVQQYRHKTDLESWYRHKTKKKEIDRRLWA